VETRQQHPLAGESRARPPHLQGLPRRTPQTRQGGVQQAAAEPVEGARCQGQIRVREEHQEHRKCGET
jgi:hypothetical protein